MKWDFKLLDRLQLQHVFMFFSNQTMHIPTALMFREIHTPSEGFIWLLTHCGYKLRLSDMITETTPPHTCAISPSDCLQHILDKKQSTTFVQGFLFGGLRWLSWLKLLSNWSVE